MVRESDAAALVTDVMLLLGQRGHQVAITPANGPRLVRLGALMLAEFGIADQAVNRAADRRHSEAAPAAPVESACGGR